MTRSNSLAICCGLALILSSLPAAQETHLLAFQFEKGSYNLNQQVIETQTTRTILNKDMTPSKKAPDVSSVTTKCIVHWQVPEVTDKQEAMVIMCFRDGVVVTKKGHLTTTCEVENPKDAKKLEDPSIKSYASQVKDGFKFLYNMTTGQVHSTWMLKAIASKKPQGGRTFDYEEVAIGSDPLYLGTSMKRLPGKAVAVGYEWDLEQKLPLVTNRYHYKFVKVEKRQGWKVAKIEVTGEISKASKKIGDIKGLYYYSFELGVLLLQNIVETTEETHLPLSTQKGIGGTLVRTVRTLQYELVKTNHKK